MIERSLFHEEHEIWRSTVRRFVEKEIVPFHAQWEHDGIVPRELWLKAGEHGMLCCTVPEQYGGRRPDYLFHVRLFAGIRPGGGHAARCSPSHPSYLPHHTALPSP